MGKKMKLPFLFSTQNTESSSTITSWPWPSCSQTRTLSFRANDNIFKTMNSTFSETTSLQNDEATSPSEPAVDPVEAVIRGLTRGSSERLFFEPGETSSILEEHKLAVAAEEPNPIANDDDVPFKESVALSLESRNPSLDFKKSMEEMVEAHGIRAWEGLEELLCCYLKINGKDNHGYIVGAFVDLLLGLAFDNNNINIHNHNNNKNRCFNCDSPYSPLSFCNTSSSSSSSISSSSNYCVSSLALGLAVSDDLEIETSCNLSSLLETTEEEDEDDDDVSS